MKNLLLSLSLISLLSGGALAANSSFAVQSEQRVVAESEQRADDASQAITQEDAEVYFDAIEMENEILEHEIEDEGDSSSR